MPETYYVEGLPLYCVASDGQGLVITGGGGGGKSYGVMNFLQVHVIIHNQKSHTVSLETINTVDMGPDAPQCIDHADGVWVVSFGGSAMLFTFNDEKLSISELIRFRTEKFSFNHLTNFIKIKNNFLISGGEDKLLRLWRIEKNERNQIHQVSVIREFPDHQSEVSDGDWDSTGQRFLSCGKDGSVKVWGLQTGQCQCTITPRSIDKKMENQPLTVRSAYFTGSNDVIVCAQHPRGPAFLFLYSLASAGQPLTSVTATKRTVASMGINANRDQIAVSHEGGEKDVYSLPNLLRIYSVSKEVHGIAPGKTRFVNDNLIVSVSTDSGMNFYDPLKKQNSFLMKISLFLFSIIFIIAMIIILTDPRVASYMNKLFGQQEL